jgi:mono/diheme cytochrome c family protein
MERTLSKRRILISSVMAAGLAAAIPACSGQELPPEIDHTIQIAAKPPKAISGGTLHVTAQGLAVAADPDRDLVWLVNLNDRSFSQVALKEGDEPGRVVEDGAGRVHVALRRGGAVATIDLPSGKVIDRTAVCPAPRGLAYDAKSDVVHVACAGGELVTLPAKGGEPTRKLRIDGGDLRDVIVAGDQLFVSRFRKAELVAIDADGTVKSFSAPPAFGQDDGSFPGADQPPDEFSGPSFAATVGYRVVALSSGGFAMSHQRSLTSAVTLQQPDGYGSVGDGCDGGIVHAAITFFDAAGIPDSTPTPAFPGAALPVDMAADTDGQTFAMVAAGSSVVLTTTRAGLVQESVTGVVTCSSLHATYTVPGEPTAVQYWNHKVVVQTREPAAIVFPTDGGDPITLPGADFADTGHDLFNHPANAQNGLACASCHPEGREDGHVWRFDSIGQRRTQTVGGDVLATAPLHWDGDMPDMEKIMAEVFVHRMGGQAQGDRHVKRVAAWLGTLPAFPASGPSKDGVSAAHGKQLFDDSTVGCSGCHLGEHFTNNQTMDVGTGKPFQVPTLVGVAGRAPYMHDGCAKTLKDRFTISVYPNPSGQCGGGDKHGHTSQLSPADIDDLVAYLETL